MSWEREPGPMNLKIQYWMGPIVVGGTDQISEGKTYRYVFKYYSPKELGQGLFGAGDWCLDGLKTGRVGSGASSQTPTPYQSPPPAFAPSNPRSLQNQMLQQKFNEYSTLR